MLEKRKEYVDQLLDSLSGLKEKVLRAKQNDAFPFSFFRESFDALQEVSRTLHQLEFMQIDEMRGQMERLVNFLSETEAGHQPKQNQPIRKNRHLLFPKSRICCRFGADRKTGRCRGVALDSEASSHQARGCHRTSGYYQVASSPAIGRYPAGGGMPGTSTRRMLSCQSTGSRSVPR